jgi:hypothetical protein
MIVVFSKIYIGSNTKPDLSTCFSAISIPIYVKHNIQYREGSSGRFELTVGPKQTMGKTVRIIFVNSIQSFLFSLA